MKTIGVISSCWTSAFLFLALLLVACGETKRTQEPKGPLPYLSEDITFTSFSDSVLLSGTITTPAADGLGIAVVLVGGSGPTDRDYKNRFEHRPFLVLADYLTRQGLVVLRYDERGVGKSKGDFSKAAYEDMAADLASGIKLLKDRGLRNVGVIGHSEGGGVAALASGKENVDFMVLMATDNFTADITLIYQTANRLKEMDVDMQTREELITTLDGLLTILKTEPNAVISKTKMETFAAERNKMATEAFKKAAAQLGDADQLIEGFLDPKFIYRVHHSSRKTLKKVRMPVLVLYGEYDNTINVQGNIPLMEDALDSTQHEIKVFPGLGHLFMNSKGVPVERLHEVEETISPAVLSYISDWIVKTVK